jgi:hypothetical protein
VTIVVVVIGALIKECKLSVIVLVLRQNTAPACQETLSGGGESEF